MIIDRDTLARSSPHRRRLMAVLVVVNLFVPARFHWREELARLSLLNRQIFQAHTSSSS